MPPRKVYHDGSTAAMVARWLLVMDWNTRHEHMNILRRNPGKTTLVRRIRERMSPCELIDGLETGIVYTTPDISIPMPDVNPKRYRQSTLHEFVTKRHRNQ